MCAGAFLPTATSYRHDPYGACVLPREGPPPTTPHAPCDDEPGPLTFEVPRARNRASGEADSAVTPVMVLRVTTRTAHAHNHKSANRAVVDVSIDVAGGDANGALVRVCHEATMSRDMRGPKMWHDVGDVEHRDDLLRALAFVAASYGITTGGEVWRTYVGGAVVWCTIPFSIGRAAIEVVDGATGASVAAFTTRGRNGSYATTSTTAGALTAKQERAVVSGDVTHPQLPLLREIVGHAASGVMRLSGARVKWQARGDLGAVAPLEMTVTEVADPAAFVAISSPVIRVGVNPVTV